MKRLGLIWVLTMFLAIGVVGLVSAAEQDEVDSDWLIAETAKVEIRDTLDDPMTVEDFQRKLAGSENYYYAIPWVSYNDIEHWRWGMWGFGIDYSPWIGFYSGKLNYSFFDRSVHGDLSYAATFDEHVGMQLRVRDDLIHEGLYQGDIFWQRVQEARASMYYSMKTESSFLNTHLATGYLDRTPESQPGEYLFDTGNEMTLEVGLHGVYHALEGKVQLEYGVPTGVTDFDYLRSQILLTYGVKLTGVDRLKLSGQIGMVRGNYPTQEQFYLGDSQFGWFPSPIQRLQQAISNMSPSAPYTFVYEMPNLYLNGFRDGAYAGDTMYLLSLEYQRYTIYDLLYWKSFVMMGDAWTGGLIPTSKPKTSLGFGIGLDLAQKDYRSYTKPTNVSFNVAYGFGEEAALTVGIEGGVALEFADLFGVDKN